MNLVLIFFPYIAVFKMEESEIAEIIYSTRDSMAFVLFYLLCSPGI